MNKFSSYYFKRYLVDEQWLAIDNYIQEDGGHSEKNRGRPGRAQVLTRSQNSPAKWSTNSAGSWGLILFYFFSLFTIAL